MRLSASLRRLRSGDSMSETFEGGCSCGAVPYRLKSRPRFTHRCHCLDCQNQTGSAFAINALIETSRIEMLAGEPHRVEMPSPSGRRRPC